MQNLDKIKVLIPTKKEFKKYEHELKRLYEINQNKLCDTNSFEFIRDNTLFYAFIQNETLIGAIYFFIEKSKLFLNAFSKRKCFELNLECLA